MDTTKFLEILRITIPVFALLGLGNILSRAGKMSDSHQAFLNWLVYYISLPALIFVGMAAQPIRSLLNADFIIVTQLAMFAIFAVALILSLILRLDKKIAVIIIFSTYWSNCAYMGFPLAQSAFGERGFLFAAIVNSVTMPVMVAITFVMIGLCSEKKQSVLVSLRTALVNPIILASAAGILFAWGADALGYGGEGGAILPAWLGEAFGICETVLKNVGTMGLSLALLAIGGKLRFRSLRQNVLPMSAAVCCKLAVLPLITLLLMRCLFPSADRVTTGSAVLLMSLPSAVTGAVIAAKFKLDEQLVSATLAVSMLAGVVMIPVWLYVVL